MTKPETARVPCPMRTLPKEPPVHLTLLADQSDDAAVDGARGLGPQAPHEAADLDDRAWVAALTDHLVDACGAQPGVLDQGSRMNGR